MCSCNPSAAPYYVIKQYGKWFIHSDGFCDVVPTSVWRVRLFMPIARFFLRLAGPLPVVRLIDQTFLDYRKKYLDQVKRNQREQWRATMFAEFDRLNPKP